MPDGLPQKDALFKVITDELDRLTAPKASGSMSIKGLFVIESPTPLGRELQETKRADQVAFALGLVGVIVSTLFGVATFFLT